MATPESNALLAMQLFQQPAQQFAAGLQANNELRYRIAAAQRDEQLKRDLLAEQDARAYKLADYQQTREDSRTTASEKRQVNQLTALQAKADADNLASEKRQNSLYELRAKADLENEFDKAYPQYAQAALQAGQPVKARADYESTRAGLGQLMADLQVAAVGYDVKNKKLAADMSMSQLSSIQGELTREKQRMDSLSKVTPEETKAARSLATEALRTAIGMGNIASATSKKPAAISKGLAALQSGDDTIAKSLLGDEAVTAFQGAYQSALQTLPNTKARMQERAQAQQNIMQLQTSLSRTHEALLKAGAVNPFLAEKVSAAGGGIQQMMYPVSEPKPEQSLDVLFGNGANPSSVLPKPTPGSVSDATPYKYPALSVFGLGERLGASAPTADSFAKAPANIAAFPGRLTDTVARGGVAGLQGLMTGDYSMPQSLTESTGAGLGALYDKKLGGNEDSDQIAKIRDEIARLTPSAGQAGVRQRIEYLNRLLASYSTAPSSSIIGR